MTSLLLAQIGIFNTDQIRWNKLLLFGYKKYYTNVSAITHPNDVSALESTL